MAEILDFIKKYEGQGVDVFLQEGALWPDAEASRQYLLTISEAERQHVYASLQHIIKALKEEESRILGEQKSLKAQMQHREKQQSACIAYLDSARNQYKRR